MGDGHSSGMLIAQHLKQPTRRHRRAILKCLPIWSCSGRGLPSLRCRHRSGGLLLRRFTLTPPPPIPLNEGIGGGGAVYFLWSFPWDCSRSPLATSLPCGVRTFLHPLPLSPSKRGTGGGGSGHLISLQRAFKSIA